MMDIRWNPSAKDLRGFGTVILVGFGLIGLAKVFWPFDFLITRNVAEGIRFAIGAFLVGVPAVLGWRIILPFYWAWMGLGFMMHKIMFPIMFSLFFYLAFFPIGLFMRLIGHDSLKLQKHQVVSYWADIEQTSGSEVYERQY